GVASCTLGMTATILEYAKKSLGLINENPARWIKKPPDRKQRRFLSILEITTMGGVIRNAEKEAGNATAMAAIRLLLLTGFRRTEALALRRTWVDGRAGCIRFPDTKSGPQLRPVGKRALEVIAAELVRDNCTWVFAASRGDGHLIGLTQI